MDTAKLIVRSIVVSSILVCAGSVSCSAAEVRRGIVRQTQNPSCPNLCDVYNLQPDSGFAFIFLYSSPGSGINLIQYVDMHVEVTGYRGGCSGCAVLDVAQLKMLSTTGVRSVDGSIPSNFQLSQNYPNPFNPTTTFRYQVPARPPGAAPNFAAGQAVSGGELVTLRVFDLLGREVATILNERKPPGQYSLSWDARGTPSGVYFCRLQSGRFSETRKMIVLP